MAEVSDEKVKDRRILDVARKVTRTADSSLKNFFGGPVTIKMKDGQTYHHEQKPPLGTPDRPASKRIIEDKFRANVEGHLSKTRAEAVI